MEKYVGIHVFQLKTYGGTVSAASVKTARSEVPESALRAAKLLSDDSGRRTEIPVRNLFVRNDDAEIVPPLARLVGTGGGRGGEVPVKLYLALIWRCAAEPYETDILARQWAELLGLNEPATLGARRITKALSTLKEAKLVELTPRRGESTIVTLLDESGSGEPYRLPSTAHQRASSDGERRKSRYFKVPIKLWTEGHIQEMSASAIAMLLVLLEERNVDGRPTWWSTELFPQRFNLSPTARSKGTTELESRGLLLVVKELVGADPRPSFTRQRVRNTYMLRGDARPEAMIKSQKERRAELRKPRTKRS